MESLRLHRAFTLIELLVVLAIITIVMAVVFTSQSSFNKTFVLTDTAYDIALTLRDAETYGLGSSAINANTNTGYGVDFQNATPGTFTLFADTYPPVGSNPSTLCHTPPVYNSTGPSAQPGNCAYDASQGEMVTNYTLGNGITISNFCASQNGGWSCENATSTYSGGLPSLDIVFARPNPIPFISAGGVYSTLSPVTEACIAVTSPQGGFKYVSVAASGEITANAASCP
jgi:prepilin-type N-terminal cleavage/methylation domain-containing protein